MQFWRGAHLKRVAYCADCLISCIDQTRLCACADPLLAVLIGKAEPKGTDRRRQQDQGKAGAGKSTLNRPELTPEKAYATARYKKIVYQQGALDELLTDLFLEAYAEPPARIVLDLDATDDPVHGNQEGRFFHGYYCWWRAEKAPLRRSARRRAANR
jgi:Transposase DDE domain group 1